MEIDIALGEYLASKDMKRRFLVKKMAGQFVKGDYQKTHVGLLDFASLTIIWQPFEEVQKLIANGSMVNWKPFEKPEPTMADGARFVIEG